jgi:hypothetical protein
MNDDTLAQWHAEQMDALREIIRLLKILTCEHLWVKDYTWVKDYSSPYGVGKTAQVPRVSCNICGKVKSPGVV